MNIKDALDAELTQQAKLSESYILHAAVSTSTVYSKPVDFRVRSIHYPLTAADIEFVYKTTTGTNVRNQNITLATYVPVGSYIIVGDDDAQVTSYGTPVLNADGVYEVPCDLTIEPDEPQEIVPCDNEQSIIDMLNSIIAINNNLKRSLNGEVYTLTDLTADIDPESSSYYSFFDKVISYAMIMRNDADRSAKEAKSALDEAKVVLEQIKQIANQVSAST